jgi:hypothetical protein
MAKSINDAGCTSLDALALSDSPLYDPPNPRHRSGKSAGVRPCTVPECCVRSNADERRGKSKGDPTLHESSAVFVPVFATVLFRFFGGRESRPKKIIVSSRSRQLAALCRCHSFARYR